MSLGQEADERWLERGLPHFVLHYEAFSAAARDLALIEARLESLCDRLASTLQLRNEQDTLLHVVLAESLDEELEDRPILRADQAAVTVVYRADSPGEGLERGVAQGILSQLGSERVVVFPTAKPARAYERQKDI